jgi:putative RecB family exonuclease
VTLVWHYLAFDTEVRSRRTPEQLEALRTHVLERVRHIEAQSAFPTRTSNLCDWCEYKRICPAWGHLYPTEVRTEDEQPLEDGAVLVDEYLRVSDDMAVLKARQDELKELISTRAARDGVERLVGSGGSIKVFRYPSVSLPDAKDPRRPALEAEVRELGLWDAFSSLSSYQLSRALQDGAVPPEGAARLEPYIVRSEGVKLYPSRKAE